MTQGEAFALTAVTGAVILGGYFIYTTSQATSNAINDTGAGIQNAVQSVGDGVSTGAKLIGGAAAIGIICLGVSVFFPPAAIGAAIAL